MDHSTKYWHKIDAKHIQCDLCPRACKLQEGQRGFCFVRARKNDQVILTSYGRSSGFCIDPVEKKPLNHFLPGTPVLSFGTTGCNLGCKFCQNWDLSEAKSIDILADQADPKTIAKAAKYYKCKSVAFTYNEPIIFMEYAIDTAIECHKLGIKTIAVTNGYICEEPRKEFFSHMDAANVDLKGFSENFYSKITLSHLEPILETLKYIKNETDCWLEITTLLIPGENDDENEIEKEALWIKENLGTNVPLHFTAFHPAYKMMRHSSTPLETLKRARNIAIKNGLNYVYTGNIYDPEGNITYCHNCKNKLIAREGYEISTYNLTKNGLCNKCKTKCAGVFENAAGTWGSKRLPINLKDFR